MIVGKLWVFFEQRLLIRENATIAKAIPLISFLIIAPS